MFRQNLFTPSAAGAQTYKQPQRHKRKLFFINIIIVHSDLTTCISKDYGHSNCTYTTIHCQYQPSDSALRLKDAAHCQLKPYTSTRAASSEVRIYTFLFCQSTSKDLKGPGVSKTLDGRPLRSNSRSLTAPSEAATEPSV